MAPPDFSGRTCAIDDSGKSTEIVQHKHEGMMDTRIPRPDFEKTRSEKS
jgi:hypothetical protein